MNQYFNEFAIHLEAGKQKDEERKKVDDARALEKQSLEAELLSVQMSFKELHSRYEDLKIVQETYRRVRMVVFPFLGSSGLYYNFLFFRMKRP